MVDQMVSRSYIDKGLCKGALKDGSGVAHKPWYLLVALVVAFSGMGFWFVYWQVSLGCISGLHFSSILLFLPLSPFDPVASLILYFVADDFGLSLYPLCCLSLGPQFLGSVNSFLCFCFGWESWYLERPLTPGAGFHSSFFESLHILFYCLICLFVVFDVSYPSQGLQS